MTRQTDTRTNTQKLSNLELASVVAQKMPLYIKLSCLLSLLRGEIVDITCNVMSSLHQTMRKLQHTCDTIECDTVTSVKNCQALVSSPVPLDPNPNPKQSQIKI